MRTTLVVLFFVNVIQKRAIVTKCKVSFKIGSNPRTMPLCYAMLCYAGLGEKSCNFSNSNLFIIVQGIFNH